MIAPTDSRADRPSEEPTGGPPEPDRRPAPPAAAFPAGGRAECEQPISFWIALMRCLAAVHS
jgi:hypothetical protein